MFANSSTSILLLKDSFQTIVISYSPRLFDNSIRLVSSQISYVHVCTRLFVSRVSLRPAFYVILPRGHESGKRVSSGELAREEMCPCVSAHVYHHDDSQISRRTFLPSHISVSTTCGCKIAPRRKKSVQQSFRARLREDCRVHARSTIRNRWIFVRNTSIYILFDRLIPPFRLFYPVNRRFITSVWFMDMLIDRIQDNHYRFRIWSLLKLVGIRLCIPDFNIAVNDSLSIELQSICSPSSIIPRKRKRLL